MHPSAWKGVIRRSREQSSRRLALNMCHYGDSGSGSSQLVQEGPRSPESLGEHGRVLPYAYAKVVLEAEGRTRREDHAVFFGEPVGELRGGHVELVAQEGQQTAPRRRPREELGALLDEARGSLEVLTDVLPVALDDAVFVLERQDRQGVGELARAQGGVVAHTPALGHHLGRRRHPSDPEPRQPEGLGDGADADGTSTVVDGGRREAIAAGDLEPPVGFVAKQPGPYRLGQAVDAPELFFAQHGPRWVVRGVDDDQARARAHQALQLVQVVAVALGAYPPEA